VTRHIIPNVASLLIIDATLGIGAMILAETTLSFFGFGVQPPDVSLGTLLENGQSAATTRSWLFVAPAGVLVWLMLSINFVGDALRDAVDPTSGVNRG
jgi:peptide/nickel transport system permease protein